MSGWPTDARRGGRHLVAAPCWLHTRRLPRKCSLSILSHHAPSLRPLHTFHHHRRRQHIFMLHTPCTSLHTHAHPLLSSCLKGRGTSVHTNSFAPRWTAAVFACLEDFCPCNSPHHPPPSSCSVTAHACMRSAFPLVINLSMVRAADSPGGRESDLNGDDCRAAKHAASRWHPRARAPALAGGGFLSSPSLGPSISVACLQGFLAKHTASASTS